MTSRATQSPKMYPYGGCRNIDDVRFLMTMNPFARDLMDNGLFAPFPLTAADGSIAFVAYFFFSCQDSLWSQFSLPYSRHAIQNISLPAIHWVCVDSNQVHSDFRDWTYCQKASTKLV